VDNLTLVALFIMLLWIIALGFYFYSSGRQRGLEADIKQVRQLLGDDEQTQP
jgi:hypothetical protein